MKIERALLSLRPGAEWVVRGSHIEWIDQIQTQPTEEEIQTKLAELQAAEPMRLLRQERNRKLQKTDWTQYRDVSLSNDSDWKTYRQTLRDLPSTASPKIENGVLTNVTWPTKPE